MPSCSRVLVEHTALGRILEGFKGGLVISSLCLHVATYASRDDFVAFCMLLWSIWGDRNRKIFEGKCDELKVVIERAGRLLGDFFMCNGLDGVAKRKQEVPQHKW